MFDKELFQRDPRSYALKLVEDGLVTADQMLLNMLVCMSHNDVAHALDANELSPRFDEMDEDEDEDDEDEDEDDEDIPQ